MNYKAASILTLLYINITYSQTTQDIKGRIVDYITREPLVGATVSVENSEPTIGAITDMEGKYVLSNVQVGRYTLIVSHMGYKQVKIPEVLITSSRPVILNIELEEEVVSLRGVVLVARKGKEALNKMVTLSSRSFTVEESSRLAGGLSDPARVAYNFAGVTFSSPQDNGVVIRGNSPTGVLWRLNGLDVSGAAHFGGGNLAGAGLISIYSANILKGSDFFTGAFPAEFSNTTSGVFDIEFREGNAEEHKHLGQLGILGVDLASEGPINKESGSSYIANYRHGFIGYYGALAGGVEPHYQDLSFNLSFPKTKVGDFSIWGIGGLSSNIVPVGDYEYEDKEGDIEVEYREYFDDFLKKNIYFGMGAMGLNHEIQIGNSALLKSNIGYTANFYKNHTEYFLEDADTLNTGVFYPHEKLKNLESKFEVSSRLYSKVSQRITNETGMRADLLWIDSYSYSSKTPTDPLIQNYSFQENAYNISVFTQFKIDLAHNFVLNMGLTSTKFHLVNEFTLEPRIGVKWKYLPFGSISLAYGRHSKREELKTYFYKNSLDNGKNGLLLSKTDHFIASVGFEITDNLNLTIEGYYQSLFDVPVIENSSYSFANYTRLWEVKGAINNDGSGTNIGVDVTLEQNLSKGLYFLFTGSIFDSRYKDAKNIERNTPFNRNYITTLAIGKEIMVKGKNLLGFNLNATYMGGERLTPYLKEESHEAKRVIYDTDDRYSLQADPEIWLNLGITYKINKDKSTRTWGLDFQNALLTEQTEGYKYNLRSNKIEEDKVLFLLPNLYYKIVF